MLIIITNEQKDDPGDLDCLKIRSHFDAFYLKYLSKFMSQEGRGLRFYDVHSAPDTFVSFIFKERQVANDKLVMSLPTQLKILYFSYFWNKS